VKKDLFSTVGVAVAWGGHRQIKMELRGATTIFKKKIASEGRSRDLGGKSTNFKREPAANFRVRSMETEKKCSNNACLIMDVQKEGLDKQDGSPKTSRPRE